MKINKDIAKDVGKGAIVCLIACIVIAGLMTLDASKSEKKVSKATQSEPEETTTTAAETTTTTTTVVIQPPKDVRQNVKPDPALSAECMQAFYEALGYYDSYRLIFNTLLSAKVLDDDQMEQDAIDDREALEVTVGKLWPVLEKCGTVPNRWLDRQWG